MEDTLIAFFNSPEKQKTILELSINLALCVIGIGFTLFTVLQSFIESKTGASKSYQKAIKERKTSDNPMIYETEQVRLAQSYIKRQKALVSIIRVLMFVSIVILAVNCYPKFDSISAAWFYVIDFIVLVFYIMGLLIGTFMYFNLYEENVNNKSIPGKITKWWYSKFGSSGLCFENKRVYDK